MSPRRRCHCGLNIPVVLVYVCMFTYWVSLYQYIQLAVAGNTANTLRRIILTPRLLESTAVYAVQRAVSPAHISPMIRNTVFRWKLCELRVVFRWILWQVTVCVSKLHRVKVNLTEVENTKTRVENRGYISHFSPQAGRFNTFSFPFLSGEGVSFVLPNN